ncbi:MAG: hypothetical protein J1F02_07870 [Lachnospiraceae bacterium]|nr:hypothetical protein [Lachnospiraceae bacterium]
MIKELGTYKTKLSSILKHSEPIRKLLLGPEYTEDMAGADKALDEYIRPHLYAEPSITGTHSYLFYDTGIAGMQSNTKTMKLVIQILTHRDCLPREIQGYEGTEADILAAMVEGELCGNLSARESMSSFGIGRLELIPPLEILSYPDYYGKELVFHVPDFR